MTEAEEEHGKDLQVGDPSPNEAPDTNRPKPDTRKRRGVLALFAVVLSLGALVLAGYGLLQVANVRQLAETPQTPAYDHSPLESQLARVDSGLNDNENELQAVKRSQDGLERRLSDLDTFNDRIERTERSLENLQGVSETARQTWVLSEAQYYLQSANTRLQLAGDINTAVLALKAADDRLAALGDPGLYRVRQLLADEILALEAIPQPDIAGIALQLASLKDRIEQLPLKSPLPDIEAEADDLASDEEEAGLDRAVSKVVGAFSGLVTYRKTDEAIAPLLTQEEEYLLIRNLQLQLQTARLALLQNRQAEFQTSLRASRQWIDEHFETSDPAVANTLSKLTEIEAIDIQPNLPDISGSLIALKSINGNAQ